MIQICPSILNADRDNLPSEIARISGQSDLLHLDVMDNIFVPNFTFTFEESEKIIAECPIPVDSHLMIADPDERAYLYAKAGSASVTFHYEASSNPLQTILGIREAGSKVGLALKPATQFHEIASLMEHLDMLLIMTVEPGFGGQSLIQSTLEKVAQARSEIRGTGLEIALQVDGGVTEDNIGELAKVGADVFVAGSAVFKNPDRNAQISELRALARAHAS